MRWIGLGFVSFFCVNLSLMAVPLAEDGLSVAVAFNQPETAGKRILTPGLLANLGDSPEWYRVSFVPDDYSNAIVAKVQLEQLGRALHLMTTYAQMRDTRSYQDDPRVNIVPISLGLDLTGEEPTLCFVGMPLDGSFETQWIPLNFAAGVKTNDRFIPEPYSEANPEIAIWKYISVFYNDNKVTKYGRVWLASKNNPTMNPLRTYYRAETDAGVGTKMVALLDRREYIDALSVVESAQGGTIWFKDNIPVRVIEVAIDSRKGKAVLGVSFETFSGDGPHFAKVNALAMDPSCWSNLLGN